MAMHDNYRLLIEKLDQFIRKYYINQLIRGSLYSVALILVLFLGLNFLEHYFYFHAGTRKVLFYSFIGVSTLSLCYWVVLPLLHYFRLGSVISHERAAAIVGDHFSGVKDKLLNVLQLHQQADQVDQKDLILASIDQKSEEIKPVPFKAAINLAQNKKYLRYALPPLMLLIVLLFAAPSLIKDSTARLISGKEFERPAPFRFKIDKDALSVMQFGDYQLEVTIEGEQLPNEVFIDVDNYTYRLTKEAPDRFAYRFSNVQKDLEFELSAASVRSAAYTLDVLEKPNILGFEVKLDYPGYTGRKDESLNSVGDFVIPEGTNIDWIFNALHTDDIQIAFSGDQQRKQQVKRFSDDLFTFKKRAAKDEAYKVYISNARLPNADSVSYTITVIPDLYPNISVEKFQDSTDRKLLFFAGEASDDYGLTALTFNYSVKRSGGQPGNLNTVVVKKPDTKDIRYDYSFDATNLDLKPGDEVTYYFETFDNDGVNGRKSARTSLMILSIPTVEEFKQMAEQNDQQIKDNLKKALEESRKIQEDMKKMREKLLQEKDLDWKSRKELEKLLDRQKELEKQIDQAKQSFEENKKNQEEFSETDQKLAEKQEKLQELFEQVMSEEMKELMEQIEELLQELEKEGALEMMEDFQFEDEDMEKELDRMLEMFKQLELEQELNEAIDELNKLAEEQKELSEKTEQDKESQEELKKEQEEINEKFDKLEEKMEEIEKKNEEMESPKEMEDKKEEMEDIQKDLNNSKEQLQQQQNKKASKAQKSASDKMKEMANQMAMEMQSGEMEQMEEDMKALRQLLENLVGLSFDQEDLIKNFSAVEINTPKYVALVQEQFKLQDDFRLVEDSLQALSKRVFQIESFVTEKVSDIKANMRESLKELEERQKLQAGEHQQRGMKNINDLALMLSEVMNQMQQQMSGMMSGDQMCTNPNPNGKGGKKPSDKMSQGQQELNEQMKKMKDGLQKGKGGSSKEFAQMAAKQAAMRKALREKQQELQKKGQGSKELQDIMDQMDKVEIDLVNKRLNNETLKRQEEIMTRLLEHEKAERERGLDEQRKAETATQKERKMPPSLEEYIKKREAEIEQYKTVSPALKPYYKQLVEDYFKTLKAK
ncbi:MAG: DUF4175 family protein [Saprospiraceae bacterium]|nr:DUF4175 family protein [Saprospiraceae bacterium]MDZ4704253.1 DUF4175 family protein [Saprospiraceae bacterium]